MATGGGQTQTDVAVVRDPVPIYALRPSPHHSHPHPTPLHLRQSVVVFTVNPASIPYSLYKHQVAIFYSDR